MLFCQVNPAFLLIQPPFSVTIRICLPLLTICHAGGRAKRLGVLAQLEMRSVAKARGLTYMASIDVAVMMAIIYHDDQWWCIISYIYNHSYDADYGEIVVLMVVLMVVVIMMILMALDYSNKWLQFKPILCSTMCWSTCWCDVRGA